MNSPLRDQRIGKRLALTGGVRMLKQAERGGTTRDNTHRINDWRHRVADIPLETRIKPVKNKPNCYVPIPRHKSLVVIHEVSK